MQESLKPHEVVQTALAACKLLRVAKVAGVTVSEPKPLAINLVRERLASYAQRAENEELKEEGVSASDILSEALPLVVDTTKAYLALLRSKKAVLSKELAQLGVLHWKVIKNFVEVDKLEQVYLRLCKFCPPHSPSVNADGELRNDATTLAEGFLLVIEKKFKK